VGRKTLLTHSLTHSLDIPSH